MASKDIENSQEQSEGKRIGQAGNDMKIPDGTGGSHRPKNHPVDHSIPNQDKSSATNQQKSEENRAGE